MNSVLTHPSTLPTLHALRRAQSSLDTSVKRLSTGLRINSAKDDPAGLIAANHLKSEIVDVQAQRYAAQMDYYKALVADGAYGAMTDTLHEAQGLLLKSQAGPSVTTDDTESIQTQLDRIIQSIDHLSGTMHLDGAALLNGTTTLGTPGTPPTATDPGSPSTEVRLRRTDAAALGVIVVEGDDPQHPTTYSLADLAAGGKLSLTAPKSDDPDALAPQQRAEMAQKVLDAAVSQLSTQRAEVGSFMRYTVESYGNVLDITEENLTSALSQIQDADYAQEVSNFVRQKALIDANNAVLAFGLHQSRQTLALLSPITGN